MRVEKGVNLLLEKVSLEGAEKVFGLGQGQPEMLDALMVLIPTVCLKVMSLMTSSCGQNRSKSEPRVAQ